MKVLETLVGFATQLTMLFVKTFVEVLLKVLFALGRALGAVVGSWWAGRSKKSRRPEWHNRKKRWPRRRR